MWSLAPGLQGTPPSAAEVGGLSCLLRGWCLVSQDEVGSVCLNCAVTESMRLPRVPGWRESLCIRDSDMRKPCARAGLGPAWCKSGLRFSAPWTEAPSRGT